MQILTLNLMRGLRQWHIMASWFVLVCAKGLETLTAGVATLQACGLRWMRNSGCGILIANSAIQATWMIHYVYMCIYTYDAYDVCLRKWVTRYLTVISWSFHHGSWLWTIIKHSERRIIIHWSIGWKKFEWLEKSYINDYARNLHPSDDQPTMGSDRTFLL